MRFRPVILVWCLLLGATLSIAAVAWWLLGREADRVESLAAGTLANRTATVAESIDLLMAEVRDGVVEGLLAVREAPEPRIALAELVEGNPYLGAGFYFRGADAVTVWFGQREQLPLPGAILPQDAAGPLYPWTLPDFEGQRLVQEKKVEIPAATPSQAPSDAYAAAPVVLHEELGLDFDAGSMNEADEVQQEAVSQNIALKQQRAAVRKVNVDNRVGLSSLFSASSATSSAGAETWEVAEPEADSVARRDRSLADDLDPFAGPVDSFADMSVSNSLQKKVEPLTPIRRGWANPLVDRNEQWMAWISLPQGDDYLGAWLDRDAILAELSKAISLSQQDGLRFRLVDAQGQVIAGGLTGRYDSAAPERSPELTLAVGSALPQWRIETFRANGANTFGRSFRWVGGLFIVGLSGAILLGSTVLIWQAQRDAREAQRKTTFVANVSHELKTPLTSIRLFADMLHDGRVKDEAKQRAYLQTMVNETQRLTRLVNNVLDFSRLERGQRRAQVETLDLGVAVAEMIEAQRERLLADGLALSSRLPDAPLQVPVDRDALEQILLNLLDNAAKYASSGGRAEVLLQGLPDQWTLRVHDFGPGIPPSERKRVFAAFHRSDDRLTSERPGCGLGLSIAARLAEEMGGHLTLEGNEPTGCAFVLTVPLKSK